MICGIRRAGEKVSSLELRQMAGRAGRTYDAFETAEVSIMVPQQDENEATNSIFGMLPDVNSSFHLPENIAFHILPHIFNGSVTTTVEAEAWFSRSLAALQGAKPDFQAIEKSLVEWECITLVDGKWQITELGKLACKHYYHPEDAYHLKNKLYEVHDNRWFSCNAALAWGMAFTKGRPVFLDWELSNYLKSGFKSKHLTFEYEEETHAMALFCLLEHKRPKQLKYKIIEAAEDMDRLGSFIQGMAEAFRWNCEESFWNILSLEMKHGVPKKTAKLMYNTGIISKSLASWLSEFNVGTKDEVLDKWDVISQYGDKFMVAQLKERINAW